MLIPEEAPTSDPDRSGSRYSDETRREAEKYSTTHRGMVSKDLHPDTCSVCAHIAEHNWSGLDQATHCRGCCAVWGGRLTIHCVTCHRTFSNVRNLDQHQTGSRNAAGEWRIRCHDPVTVTTHRGQRHYFGEPSLNPWGVPIWRAAGREER